MTLERGGIKGFEHDRMVMLFSMMHGGREVSCAITSPTFLLTVLAC